MTNPDAEQTGTSAQMLELADRLGAYPGAVITRAEISLMVAALRTAASQDARDDPCPYCGNQMHSAFDCNKCGMGSPGRDALTSPIRDAREALEECASRCRYDGDLFHDQGNYERRDASWKAGDMAGAVLAALTDDAALRAQTSPGVLTGFDARWKAIIAALKPFADIALFVEHTDQRDGEIVHRQYDREGKRVELTKDDFRRAAKVYAAFSSLPQSARVLSPSQLAERLPSSDAAGAGADVVALAGKIETIDRLFAREEYDADSAALSLMRDIWDDLKSAALAAPQPQSVDHNEECPNFPGCHCRNHCSDGWKHPSPEDGPQPQAGASEPVAWQRMIDAPTDRVIIGQHNDGSVFSLEWQTDDCGGSWYDIHADQIAYPARWIEMPGATPSPTAAGREIDEAEEQIERLNARVVDLLKEQDALKNALVGIAQFTSGDDFTTTLGAINRLVSIRNTAERVLAAVSGAGESGNG